MEFTFESPTTLRVRAAGVALRMEMPPAAWDQVLARGQDRWQINHFGARDQLLLSRLSGKVTVDAPWNGVRAEHVKITVAGEIALETFTTTAPADHARPGFVQCRQRRADRMLRDLIRHCWRGDRFLTAHGLATESPRSPLYEPDGCRRGPIRAPSTHIIYDGLRQLGERDRAREVARRFCETCRGSGLPENFDTLTGAPLRDKAYTWTASVFLFLAHDLLAEYRQ